MLVALLFWCLVWWGIGLYKLQTQWPTSFEAVALVITLPLIGPVMLAGELRAYYREHYSE